MPQDQSLIRTQVAQVLIEEMFQVKAGETVAITGDSGSDRDLADAFAAAATKVGGKPLVIWTPKASQDGQAGIDDWPSEALTALLCKFDVWIEMNSTILLYSDIWETAFAKNKKLRYTILADSSAASLLRVLTGFDIKALGLFLEKVRALTVKAQTVRITSENGTDVSYDIDLNYAFDYDDGDLSMPKFGTAPGYLNVVPKTGSMNGKIVFDLLMNANVYGTDNHLEFIMKDGKIADVVGGDEANNFKKYLSSFDDENMYKISHNMFGFNPSVRELCGEVVEDERIWGGVDFGFGHTSPMDMPPNGQPAKSHFDGIVGKASIYLDDAMIVSDGEVCHPELTNLADEVLASLVR